MITPYIERISTATFENLKEKGKTCDAVISKCRRSGYVYGGKFYYRTPDQKCFLAHRVDHIIDYSQPSAPSEPDWP